MPVRSANAASGTRLINSKQHQESNHPPTCSAAAGINSWFTIRTALFARVGAWSFDRGTVSAVGANEDRLASLALQLVARVHDDVPLANGMWLTANTTEEDRWALLFILAAAVPTDRSWSELTSWVRFGDLSEFGDGRPDTPEKIAARREEWTRRAA